MCTKLGLYIHIPFCKRKCFYCDFVSVEYKEELSKSYISSLLKEAGHYKNEKINTIYIGGGTPSVLTSELLEKLILNIKSIFNVSSLEEFTVELNPESTTKDKLKLLYSLGITRISFGLQSTKDANLKELGRLHNYDKFLISYNMATEIGFNNISIDLMYGIPNQTLTDWENVLKETMALDSAHISLYPLTIEPNTLFYKQNVQTDGDLQRKMYDMACNILEQNNFCHYEISNWSKGNKFSRHNKIYWQNNEYIGLGASASSYYKRYRYKNITDINKYIDLINKKEKCTIEKEYIDDDLYNIETVMLGLRLKEGVNMKFFKKKEHIIKKFTNEGLLQIKDNNVSLTQKGLFVSNSIISEFV